MPRPKKGVGKAKKSGCEGSVQPACKRKKESYQYNVSDDDDDEPAYAAPARKQVRPPSSPKPRTIPTPRGEPAAKPKQVSASDLSPASLALRHKRDRKYAKTAHAKAAFRADPLPELNERAAQLTKTGKVREGPTAEASARRRNKERIVAAVKACGNEDQQALALHDASEAPSIARQAAVAGFHPTEEVKVALYAQQQQQRMLLRATATDKPRGHVNDDRRGAVQAVVTFMAESPQRGEGAGRLTAPTLAARARGLKLPMRTARRLLKHAAMLRLKLTEQEWDISWATVKARKGYTKITEEVRAELHDWVLAHPHVVVSPIANDTRLVVDPKTHLDVRVACLLREVSVRELHNDLIKPVEEGGLACARVDGKVIISDTALRYLLPAQLKRMTQRHKQMCGCETCLTPRSLQESLNAHRSRVHRSLAAGSDNEKDRAKIYGAAVLPGGTPVHARSSDAVACIQCDNLPGTSFPDWNCVLRRCEKCPKYQIPLEERGIDADAPRISFHVYITKTSCSKHGYLEKGAKKCPLCVAEPPPPPAQKPAPKRAKITDRKHLTQLTRPVGVFHRDYYLPALEKLTYHLAYVKILSKYHCAALRDHAFRTCPGSAKTKRDYAERLAAAFTLEIQAEHFGNGRSLSMEGSSVETFCSAVAARVRAQTPYTVDDADVHMHFHSHFSDASRQDAASTHAHMTVLLNILMKETKELLEDSVLWDDTDGCGKQYRCAKALYLLSLLSVHFHVAIDRAIGAPGHGKDIIDALNAIDKQFLRAKMCMIGTPEANDGTARMAAHTMIEDAAYSLATECARLCGDPARAHGVKSHAKYAKREGAAKMEERFYHVQDPADVHFTKLKKTVVGLPAGEHNGLLSRYNLRTDPQLGVGRAALRRVPCACNACVRQLQLPWSASVPADEQPRYAQNRDCQWWKNFHGLNDWVIVSVVPAKDTDPEEEEEGLIFVLEGVETRMSEQVQVGNKGAFSCDDSTTDGYYIVEWTSEPYTLQEDKMLTEFKPAMQLKAGALVCDAIYLEKAPGGKLWFTRTIGEQLKTTVRLQQVLAANLTSFEPISMTNPVPSRLTKKQKKEFAQYGAERLGVDEHEEIVEEICRREILEHEDIIESGAEESDVTSDEEESSEEEEGADS